MEITDKADIKDNPNLWKPKHQELWLKVLLIFLILDQHSLDIFMPIRAREGAAGFEVSHYSPPHIPSTLI